MKRTLVMPTMMAIALTGCSAASDEMVQNKYKSLDDCRKDWSVQECKPSGGVGLGALMEGLANTETGKQLLANVGITTQDNPQDDDKKLADAAGEVSVNRPKKN